MGFFANIFPELSVVVLAILLIILKLVTGCRQGKVYGYLSIAWLAATIVIMLLNPPEGVLTWGRMLYIPTQRIFA